MEFKSIVIELLSLQIKSSANKSTQQNKLLGVYVL